MKNILLLTICAFISLSLGAQTIYRVNNNTNLSNSSAAQPNSFTTVSDAITAASNGDIIYIEPSTTNYGNINVNKSLIFIGNGYLLDGSTDGNANLQENTNNSVLERVILNAGSEGSTFKGLNVNRFNFSSIATNTNITIEKCRIRQPNSAIFASSGTFNNISITKCYFSGTSFSDILDSSGNTINNLTVENCIFNGGVSINPSTSSTNLVFRNNIATRISGIGLYVANNIFTSSTNSSFNTCVVRNNVFVANQPGVTVGPLSTNGNNLIGQTLTDIIVNSGSADGRYQLAASSPAINGGVDIGGTKPDCGAFGGPDPYKLSGIPDIPTIYELSLPNGNSVPAGTTTIDIDFSTRSNN
ncbi:MAG: hypothetical protein GVY05_10075 [Bacteroidetes bacterium]|jgi:hypothetical protein|nr:hypothetical protein [Bacteroidota bacterium]